MKRSPVRAMIARYKRAHRRLIERVGTGGEVGCLRRSVRVTMLIGVLWMRNPDRVPKFVQHHAPGIPHLAARVSAC